VPAKNRPKGRGTGGTRRADPVRRAACDVLIAVAQRDAYANLLLPSVLAQRGLTGRDAALATELTYGTLRGRGTYDAILTLCCDRPLDQIDVPVLEVLRLGCHQLLATRVQPHAAVATSVDLARDIAGARVSGFVNAILRRVAGRDLDAWIGLAAPAREADPLGYLAVCYSHPRWIVAAVAEALGEDLAGELAETGEVLAADGTRPRVTLCAVPGLAVPGELFPGEADASADPQPGGAQPAEAEAPGHPAGVSGSQERQAGGAEPARWSPFGAYLKGGDPAAVAAVREGRAGVQDEASQLAALALARADIAGRDSRWLDLCAGPGGKARLLAGLAAQRGARLVAADARPHRAKLAGDAVAVTGAAAAVASEGTAPAWRRGSFDRVIADVPCSGIGALRRRPEARWRKSSDGTDLSALQRRLLGSAIDSARPGGVVAYVTCSPQVSETSQVVEDVLSGRDDVAVLDAPAVLAEVPGLRCPEPGSRFAQFWPHRHGTDAIFLALLRRDGPDAASKTGPMSGSADAA
jgi:16S rRNA (cytosine967-C5)-methyltransferase